MSFDVNLFEIVVFWLLTFMLGASVAQNLCYPYCKRCNPKKYDITHIRESIKAIMVKMFSGLSFFKNQAKNAVAPKKKAAKAPTFGKKDAATPTLIALIRTAGNPNLTILGSIPLIRRRVSSGGVEYKSFTPSEKPFWSLAHKRKREPSSLPSVGSKANVFYAHPTAVEGHSDQN